MQEFLSADWETKEYPRKCKGETAMKEVKKQGIVVKGGIWKEFELEGKNM